MKRPMSMNGYSWVEGNTPNATDPSGKSIRLSRFLNGGICQSSSIGSSSNCYLICFPLCIWWCDGVPLPPGRLPDDIAEDTAEELEDLFDDILGGGPATSSSDWTLDIPRVGQLEWVESIPNYRDRPPESCDDERIVSAGIRRCPDSNFNTGVGTRGNFSTFRSAFKALGRAVDGTGGISFNDSTDDDISISSTSDDEVLRRYEDDRWEHSDTCNGGMHWNINGLGGRRDAAPVIATVLCCPCCDDDNAQYAMTDYDKVFGGWACNLDVKF